MNPYIKQANQQFVPVYNRYPIVWDHGEGMYLYDTEDQQSVPVYNRYPIVWDHGEGMYLYDTEGKRYLDFGSGIGVCALGYHDQNYTRTLQEQMEKLLHTPNLFYNVPAIEAAKLFNQASGMEQVFFTNSGTEAIEGAVKSGLESVCVLWDITIRITHVHCKNRWRSCYTPLIFFIMFLRLKLQSCSIRHLAWSRCFSPILEQKQSKVRLKLLRNIIF